MINLTEVSDHYTTGDLANRILAGIRQAGKSQDVLSIDDLAAVDEFHIRGREATRVFLDQLTIEPQHHVLDIGCGLGGASRFASFSYGCTVTGLDLTQEFVETGNLLNEWVSQEQSVRLVQGNALEMHFSDNSFDIAFMLHAGMNISNKAAIVAEAWRVLKPGGVLGIYDVMLIGSGELTFPVPWASHPAASAVGTPDQYKKALAKTGFVLETEQSRLDESVEFFQRLQAKSANDQTPPPLGLHLLLGENGPQKVRNMIDNINKGIVAPVELIARKPT